jgi:hypothetical protein
MYSYVLSIKIGLVAGLERKEAAAQDRLRVFGDLQPKVIGVVEWYSWSPI